MKQKVKIMWSKIVSFILDKSNHRFLLLVGFVIASLLFFNQCQKTQQFKAEVQKQKNNIEALNDSVRYYENKAGETTAEKLALESDVEQLETLNSELHEELQKERGKVKQLTKITAELKADTVEADTVTREKIDLDTWQFNWNFSRRGNGWARYLEGYMTMRIDSRVPYDPNFVITRDELQMQLITGIRESDGKKQIFVRSTYPNLTVTKIQGAIINNSPIVEKQSRFGLGPSIGVGYTPDGFHPYVGFNLNYNIISL